MKKFFKMSPSHTIALSVMTLSAVAGQAYAGTITVCPNGSCNFTDPVAAIAAAAAGDIIEIQAGTYMLGSTISVVGGIAGKPLVIRGAVDASGHPTTVLNAGGTKQVFGLVALGATTSFENLVITNGRADYGGAVTTYGANVVFRNCAFRSNRASYAGGAIYLNDSDPLLIDCEFTDNLASNTQGAPQAGGGAIYVGNNTLTLTRCSFTANASNYYGGAIFVTGGSNPGRVNLQSTRICGNTAPNGPQIGMSAGAIITDLGGACISDNCINCPPAPACPADLDGNGLVGGSDLGRLLGAWGPCTDCPADINGDGLVSGTDLGAMLGAWGACQ
ncbi:MAG: hypothetical protein CK544_05895 [Planctomycetaceae bacterium]|nr:MAG: hypothetical protein CK544_05895 [Planctomycetaceae bacterium]